MQFTVALIALAAAGVTAQSTTESIGSIVSPSAAAPSGCATTYASSFEITVNLPSTKKRDLVERDACAGSGTLVATLNNGILTDAKGRIGSIVANHQFQFDGPPAQAGFIYDAGWSVCSNGSLALGGSAVFYQCLSGDFYNLYDESTGAQCEEVIINVIPCGSSSGASQTSDGQVQATSAASQISDGQVQATSAVSAVSQISDGQIQATSAVSAASTSAVAAVSQISDGQIQASSAVSAAATSATPTVVSQISDGQIQAQSAAVLQSTDGQILVTASPVSAAAVAATTAASAAGSSITTSYGAPVSQISDGQIQATAASNATVAATSATKAAASATYTGAAFLNTVNSQLMAGAGAILAVAAFRVF